MPTAREWAGGERYGFENDDYYAEFRGQSCAAPTPATRSRCGSRPSPVTATADGRERPGRERHLHLHGRAGHRATPSWSSPTRTTPASTRRTRPASTAPEVPRRARRRARCQRRRPPTSGTSTPRACPTTSACSSHYAAVVWYLGDNRLTQDPEDELTQFGSRPAARPRRRRAPAVPDDGRARLPQRGRQARLRRRDGRLLRGSAGTLGGIYYGLDGAPEEECVVTVDPFSDCLLLADDFTQYYLGRRTARPLGAAGIVGTGGDARRARRPRSAARRPSTTRSTRPARSGPTSDVLPPDEFPQFGQRSASPTTSTPIGPFIAVEGDVALGAVHADDSYMRLRGRST